MSPSVHRDQQTAQISRNVINSSNSLHQKTKSNLSPYRSISLSVPVRMVLQGNDQRCVFSLSRSKFSTSNKLWDVLSLDELIQRTI